MEVRHNTALLEKAVELVVLRAAIPAQQAEAEALRKRAAAISQRRLATGIAIAVAALGVGLGFYLGFWNNRSENIQRASIDTRPTFPEPQSGTSAKPTSSLPNSQARPAPDKITVDFTKFASLTVQFLGRRWSLSAGHRFASDRDPTWSSAWCYTEIDVDGANIKIDLADRANAEVKPVAPIATKETLAKAGLDDESALALATKCPWLDNRIYRINEFSISPNRKITPAANPNSFEQRGRTLHFKGKIDADFAGMLRQRDFDKLTINSRGGLLKQAVLAGNWLRSAGKAVEIDDECLSACVFVLAGGSTRQAPSNAKVGVHRFYSTNEEASKKDMEIGQQIASEILLYLDRMGIDQALFHSMAAVPSEDMAYLDHATLQKWRLLGSTINQNVPARTALPEPNPVTDTSTSSVVANSFGSLDEYDALGNDAPNMPIRAIDQMGCERLCRENAECAGYTYNKKANVCFLKNAVSIVFPNPVAFTGYRNEAGKRPKISKLQSRIRRQLTGVVYRRSEGVMFDNCAISCDAERSCKALSYDTATRLCSFFSSVEGETEQASVWSAVKLDTAINER